MSRINLFPDSSALIAGIVSSQGAARALLLLGESDKIDLSISEQVIAEVEHNIARKIPRALSYARQVIYQSKLRILPDPAPELVRQHADWISHEADVPILVAAVEARVAFLVTMNSRHFLVNPQVAERSGLRIGTPGDALIWVREQLIG
jgi:predicted nucleic acid-binding protein